MEVTLVVDVVHFVGTRLIEVSVVIQACDSQAVLLLSAGSFYQLQIRNQVVNGACSGYRRVSLYVDSL